MAAQPKAVEDLMEDIEIKDVLIKRLYRDISEMTKEKDHWWNLYITEKITSTQKDTEVAESRKQVTMFESRVSDAERRIKDEFEKKLREIYEEMKLRSQEREEKLLKRLQAEYKLREEQLRGIIDIQNTKMAEMEKAIPKPRKFFGWFKLF